MRAIGALQVPFGEFTGCQYVQLDVTIPVKWDPLLGILEVSKSPREVADE
jgi:hypothetical protein